jgi:hypothetical protein
MSTVKCRDCGNQISKKAKSCPQCGAPQRRTSPLAWTVLILIVGWVGYTATSVDQRPRAASTPSASPAQNIKLGYIHQTTNLRTGAGTNFEIAGKLHRGDVVQITATEGDWSTVIAPGVGKAFVHRELLKEKPLPPLEIASWNWRADHDFGTKGAVIWNVELRNNTDRYIDYVRVEFTSYDKNDQLITSDFSHVSGLAPGGTAATKAYATYFGRESKGRVRIVP